METNDNQKTHTPKFTPMRQDNKNQQHWLEFRAGLLACVPTLLGYLAIGFACGAIGRVNGFALAEIVALAVFVYAGSAHFLFYQLALAGSTVGAIAMAVAFINMRYLLINAYMAQFFSRFSLWQKLVSALLTTDETFGVAANHARRKEGCQEGGKSGKLPFYWLLGLNLLAWGNWILANFIGAVFASSLPDWLQDGLSFSLVGMFLGLLILAFYASHTKMVDLVVVVMAICFTLISHHVIEANAANILATLIAAFIGTILLKAIQNHRTKRSC